MFKFLLKEVHANSKGNGTGGYSKSGSNNGRKSDIGGNTNSTRPKAEGVKRKNLTQKNKGGRPSNVKA